jgi:hypothetical protein
MTHFIITISDDQGTEHYRRRVETDDINFVVQRLDQALNVKVRKRRRDAGQPRTGDTAQ